MILMIIIVTIIIIIIIIIIGILVIIAIMIMIIIMLIMHVLSGILGCGFGMVVSTHMMINYTISRTASVLLAAVLLKSAGQGTLLPHSSTYSGQFARGGGGFGALPTRDLGLDEAAAPQVLQLQTPL